ncbi:LapA family protein [Hasllibacter sp. MH4015]|uniref:LapA family protein n=1 Tax=Hasllibacter sp. MH4015 TaxID=2854029 RepID=UPI001CD32B47|nr:LapA family protein [Hasllibacter sp. MH4015]
MKILRLVKILFLVLVALALVLLFFANNEPVTLNLLPDAMATAMGMRNTYTLPLVLVVVAALLIGIVVGFVWEWLREYRHRAEARTQRREAQRLSQEVATIKGRSRDHKDEILAILDDADAAR